MGLSDLFKDSNTNGVVELSKDDVSSENLKKMLDGTKYEDSASIDDDGDLLIQYDSINYFAIVNSESNYIKFVTAWEKSDSVNENRIARIMNKWNNDKVFTRACADGSNIELDYFLTCEGGINKANFTDTLNWLFAIADSFNSFLKDEDAID